MHWGHIRCRERCVRRHAVCVRHPVDRSHLQPSEGIRRGDLVLIETSPAAWSTDVDIDSRLCVVRASGKQSKITLARATIDEMGEIEADFFSYRESRDEEQEQEFLLRVRPGQLPKLSWKKRPRGHEQVWHHPITRADVVGIAVALIRRNP